MIITSDLDRESSRELDTLGIATHVLKPYSPEMLLEKIAILMIQQQKAN